MSSKTPSNLPSLREEKPGFSDNDPPFPTFSGQKLDFHQFNLPLNDFNMESRQPRVPMEFVPESPDLDQNQRFTNIGLEITSSIIGSIVSHPCIVLRRQCQVNRKALCYHLSPFTLIPVLIRLQNRQGFGCLWKGCSGTFILRGCSSVIQTFIAEVTPFPSEVIARSSFKQVSQHILLKMITFGILTPFYCASLVETVQSDIASEKPGVLDCLKEGVCRLLHIGAPRSSRLLPLWKLVGPTVFYRISFYVLSALIGRFVLWIRTRKSNSIQEKDTIPNQSMAVSYLDILSINHFSSFVAGIIVYPVETLVHRLYLQGTRTIIDNLDSGTSVFPVITEYDGFVDGFHTIIDEEGSSGLYKGIGGLFLEYAIQAFILKVAQITFSKIDLLLHPPVLKKPHL